VTLASRTWYQDVPVESISFSPPGAKPWMGRRSEAFAAEGEFRQTAGFSRTRIAELRFLLGCEGGNPRPIVERVREIEGPAAEVGRARRVDRQVGTPGRNEERPAGRPIVDPVELPPAQGDIDQFGRLIQEPLPTADRQFVEPTGDHDVRGVKG